MTVRVILLHITSRTSIPTNQLRHNFDTWVHTSNAIVNFVVSSGSSTLFKQNTRKHEGRMYYTQEVHSRQAISSEAWQTQEVLLRVHAAMWALRGCIHCL